MLRKGVGVMKKLEEVDRALQALKAGEVDQAAIQFDRLTALAHERGKRVGGMSAPAWDLLLRLLEKRGFYVSTPGALSKSLDEIHELGQGFDLHTLMVAMARYDMTVAGCLGLGGVSPFAALRPFAPACSCVRHAAGGK
jgi:hypothetical protein